MTRCGASILACLLAAGLSGCAPAVGPADAAHAEPEVRFRGVAPELGVSHAWKPQPHPMDILQSFGRGCAFLDYDLDGRQDILLVDAPHCRLFRNLPAGRFEETTRQIGLDRRTGDWRGCAVGDQDGDGRPDLLLTGYRRLALLRSVPRGPWPDVTRAVGLDPGNRGRWGSSAGWMDLDADGRLDLVLLNYVRFGPRDQRFCQWKPGVRSGCGPSHYRPQRGEIWRNTKSGLRELPAGSGLESTHGKALVLAFLDPNGDHRPDVYIGNDGLPADLLVNQGGLRFAESGAASGVADSSIPGEPLSAMGADLADFDGDGRQDLFVTGFSDQPYSLLRGVDGAAFEHAGDASGITALTFKPLGFGARWLDMDNDGWPDLAIANGHIHDNTAEITAGTSYRQPMMLLRNVGGRRFVDVAPAMGPEVTAPRVGRGLATGDFDNDGRVDVLLVDYEGEVVLLRNESRVRNHWVTLDLRTARDGPAYGALVTLQAGGRTRSVLVSPAASYLSSNDPRVHFGLGEAPRIQSLTVRWPSGRTERFQDVAADRILRVVEGRGVAP